jgi:phytoene dehydrogenase-like protein
MTDMSSTTYDIIIVGGGHNGLVCAAYLARSGQQVLVLEANDQVGGAAVTERLSEGKRVSSCAHYLNQLNTKVARDLKLSVHGLEMAARNASTIALDASGHHLCIDSHTITGNAISQQDAASYTRFMALMREYAKTLRFLVDGPPIDIFAPDWDDKLAAIKLGWNLRFGLGAEKMSEFLRMVGMNIHDVLNDEFDDARLKGVLAFDAILGSHAGPRSPGSILTFLYRLAAGDEGALHIPKGGMGSVTQAIARSAIDLGAEIRTSARVSGVNVENCAVTGVTLEDGEVIAARKVASNADPKTTVMDLVGARNFEADFVHRIHHVRMRGTAAKLHIALQGLPEFTGLDKRALKHRLVIAPDVDEVERAFNHVKYGEASERPMMEISIPSTVDETLADQGHVMTATVQYAPYDLKGGWTEAARSTFLASCINRIADYAPDIRDQIEHVELITPTDLESRYGMRGGNWHHGELTLDQTVMLRPVPGASRYALPVGGLYLCGAGAHPGGGVMGAAGRNAAQAILKGES